MLTVATAEIAMLLLLGAARRAGEGVPLPMPARGAARHMAAIGVGVGNYINTYIIVIALFQMKR